MKHKARLARGEAGLRGTTLVRQTLTPNPSPAMRETGQVKSPTLWFALSGEPAAG